MLDRQLLRLEAKLLLRDPLALGALLMLAVASFAAVLAARPEVDARKATVASIEAARVARVAEARKALVDLGSTPAQGNQLSDPRQPYMMGARRLAHDVAPEPGPLALLGLGATELGSGKVRIALSRNSMLEPSEERANPESLLQGRYDATFVVVFLLPLALIALLHDLVSRDRALGTLALVASSTRGSRLVHVARAVLRLAAAWSCLVAGLCAGLWACADEWSSEATGLLVAWLALAGAYALFWGAAILVVGSLRGTPSSHALACCALWTVFLYASPAAAAAWVGLEQGPSRVASANAAREAAEKAWEARSSAADRLLLDHPELEQSPTDKAGLWRRQVELLAYARMLDDAAAVEARRREEALAARRARTELAAWANPCTLALAGFDALAEVDEGSQRRFLGRAAELQRGWDAFFLPRILEGRTLSPVDLDALPRLSPRAREDAAILASAWPRLGGLLAWVALAGILAWIGLGRVGARPPGAAE